MAYAKVSQMLGGLVEDTVGGACPCPSCGGGRTLKVDRVKLELVPTDGEGPVDRVKLELVPTGEGDTAAVLDEGSKIAVQVARRLAEIDGAERPRCRACGRENCTGASLGPGHCDSRPLRPTLPGDAALPPPSRRRRRRRRNP